MKKYLLGLTIIPAIALPVAAMFVKGDAGIYNGPVVMEQYKAKNTNVGELKILGHKQELAQQFGWENIGGSQDYMATLTTRLGIPKQMPTLYNVENASSLKKIDAYVEKISTKTYAEKSELNKLKSNMEKIKNSKLGGNALPAWMENFGLIYNKDKMKAAGIQFVNTNITNGFNKMNQKLNSKKLTKTGLLSLLDYLNTKKSKAGVDTVMRYPGRSGSEWPFLSHLLGASVGYKNSSEPAGYSLTSVPNFDSGVEMLHKFIEMSGGGVAVSSRAVDYQVGEFAAGRSFMIQQGSWMEGNIFETNPNIKLGMLPLVFGSENQTAMTTSQWWAINSQSSGAEKEAAAKFLNYLYFEKDGQQFMGTAGVMVNLQLEPGVTIKNKVEDAAKIYGKSYESAHTKFPGHFNSGNSDLADAYRELVKNGKSGDAVFKLALIKAWNKK